jgi:hypothetical protein
MRTALTSARQARTLLLLPALGAAPALAGCAAPAPGAIKVTSVSFGDDATGIVQCWDRSTTSPFGELIVDASMPRTSTSRWS